MKKEITVKTTVTMPDGKEGTVTARILQANFETLKYLGFADDDLEQDQLMAKETAKFIILDIGKQIVLELSKSISRYLIEQNERTKE